MDIMPHQKIAITVPPPFLNRLDKHAKKAGKSRSRFIVDELEYRLRMLEDDEITKIYNKASADPEMAESDYQLAEAMLRLCSVNEEKEEW